MKCSPSRLFGLLKPKKETPIQKNVKRPAPGLSDRTRRRRSPAPRKSSPAPRKSSPARRSLVDSEQRPVEPTKTSIPVPPQESFLGASSLEQQDAAALSSLNSKLPSGLVENVQPAKADLPSNPEDGTMPQSDSKPGDNIISQDEQPNNDPTPTLNGNAMTVLQSHDSVPGITLSRTDTLPIFDRPSQTSQRQSEVARPTSHTRRSRTHSHASSRASSPASSHSDASSDNGDILPTQVSCKLHITLDKREIQFPETLKIKWYEKSAFGVLENAAEDCLRSDRGLQDIPLHLPSFYLRNGSCRIVGKEHRMPDRKLESDLQIVEVLVIAICGFIHDHPYEPFRVLINWDYSTICVQEVDGTPYCEVIRDEIYRKMERSYLDKPYIPRTDLIRIISPETSRRIIGEDKSLLPEDKTALAAKVRSKAPKLQAACVYANLPMLALQHILANGFHDENRPSDKSDCPLAKWNTNFGDLLEKQASFFAYKFPTPNDGIEHADIPWDIIVPIQWVPGDRVLGEGSFSRVYKVKIDPVHHYFSENKTQLFALKEFKELKIENREDTAFNRELKMLKELKAFPHPHIVTHLFTWTQHERFYMLFPMARFNLTEYMRIQPAESPHTNSPTGSFVYMRRDPSLRRPVLEANFVTWLLTQLKGLGEAVKHIHQLIGDAVKLPKPDPSNRNIGRVRATGFHHDIKPDNILVFIDGGDQFGTLKISDFGSGRVQTLRSGTQRSAFANIPLGTTTYEGPDFYLMGKASRPLDLWSLGCVFLEILLWCFIPVKEGAESFVTNRFEASQVQPNMSTDNFWYPIITEGKIKNAALKDAVVKRLEMLREDHCKGRRAFTRLLKLIDQMFEIDPDKRIKAAELADALDAILKQAHQDVQTKPECYIERTFENLPESAVPIPTTPTTIPSRPPSLQELNTIFGETLSPRHAESPTFYRRRSESLGRAGVASATSNAGGHLSQSHAVQDDGLADPLIENSLIPTAQNFVRPWQVDDDFDSPLSQPQVSQQL